MDKKLHLFNYSHVILLLYLLFLRDLGFLKYQKVKPYKKHTLEKRNF